MMTARRAGFVAISLATTLWLSGCASDEEAPPEASGTPTSASPKAGAQTVNVFMAEYGYSISGPMVAGGTMKIQNTGNELHIIGVGKLKSGKNVEDLSAAFTTEGDSEAVLEGVVDEVEGPMGGTYTPGKAVDLTVPDFEAGEYVFICFLPSVGDGKPHAAKGMIGEFSVVDGEPPAVTADAKYETAPGQPVKGPASLTPGRHTLEITATDSSEKGRGLEPSLIKLVPGKKLADIDPAFEQIFGEQPPPAGYVANLPVTNSFFLHDFAGHPKVYVGVDLEPGDYVLVAADSDTEEPVTDPVEKHQGRLVPA